MNEKQTVKQRPLLYISQPNFKPTLLNVTNTVVITKKEQKHVVTDQVKEVESTDQPKDTVTVRDKGKVSKERNTTSLRKKFHDFSIEEKVKYFANFPKTMPRPLCEIHSNDEIYQGIVTSLKEGNVSIKTFKEPYKAELRLEDIDSIQIISL